MRSFLLSLPSEGPGRQLSQGRVRDGMSIWDIAIWIRVHWFELSALALLGLNLWFVFQVLSVIRAVNEALIMLGRWLDQTRNESRREQ